MPNNNPANDRYNPPQAGEGDFDSIIFSELDDDQLFWLSDNPNGDVNLAHRKLSQNEGICMRQGTITQIGPNQEVFTRI